MRLREKPTKSDCPQLCEFARDHDFVLVSKDDDFPVLVTAMGYRPKLIRLALGNVSNDRVLMTLLTPADHLERALRDPGIGVVILS
jgi:predicted nuclease of predicted toxin-antitoxin system